MRDSCSKCDKRHSVVINGTQFCKEHGRELSASTEEDIVKKPNGAICIGILDDGTKCGKRASFAQNKKDKALRCLRCCSGEAFDSWVNTQSGKSVRQPRKPSSRKLSDEELRERRKLQHQCIVEWCSRSKAYGYQSDQKRIVCSDHVDTLEEKEDDPICLLISRKKCEIPNCDHEAKFGERDTLTGQGKVLRCADHKEEFDEDLTLCRTCKIATSSRNEYYKGHCANCFYFLNPTDDKIKNFKTKEQRFMVPLKELYPDLVLDQIITGGCSKRRPDGLIDVLSHSVIVEIDEKQHQDYSVECENRRTMEIFQDLGSRPLVFIRLNPDGYKDGSRRVNSVFKKTESGTIKLRSQKEFTRRFEKLCESVEDAIHTIPTRDITLIRLFFTSQ